MKAFSELLKATAALHARLCPRQVLGVRMGLWAGKLLELDAPRSDKRLFVIAETDGCAVDGIAVATGCRVGRRTLRIEDLGKVAATMVDTYTGRAVRIVPQPRSREVACEYAPKAHNHWEAQLIGYQRMPATILFSWQWVELTTPLEVLIGHVGAPVVCQACGEEIINGREVVRAGSTVCRACAGQTYYLPHRLLPQSVKGEQRRQTARVQKDDRLVAAQLFAFDQIQ